MPVILSEVSRSNVILSEAKDLNKHLEMIPVILSEASRSNVILSEAKDLNKHLKMMPVILSEAKDLKEDLTYAE